MKLLPFSKFIFDLNIFIKLGGILFFLAETPVITCDRYQREMETKSRIGNFFFLVHIITLLFVEGAKYENDSYTNKVLRNQNGKCAE